ncbi:MAG: hypothetical protein M3Z92_08835, partial [Bacteroidota bacterium]|nr:hypothetical protein [Bacteroidota bacterium]
ENKPIVLTMGNFGGGGYETAGGWQAGNPSSIPAIQYYLKDRLSSSDVTINIYDANNKLMQTLPGTKRKGINKIFWNLRMTPPKTATGGTKMDYGGFIAPMVLPGTYTMKLKVGDKEYSSPMVLEHNASNKNFTLADRKLQFKTAMELYNLHEELASLVDDINGKQKALKSQVETVTDSKTKVFLNEYNSKLEVLRADLLSTKQVSIFAEEERLREKITNVYAAICTQEAAPSNSQIANAEFLEKQVKDAGQKEKAINEKYAAKAKTIAEKNDLQINPKSKVTNAGITK